VSLQNLIHRQCVGNALEHRIRSTQCFGSIVECIEHALAVERLLLWIDWRRDPG